MSVEKVPSKSGRPTYRVRWRDQTGKPRSKVLGRKADAVAFDAEVTRAKRLGHLAVFDDAGKQTLTEYATEWARQHAKPHLAEKTRVLYAWLLERHILPKLGGFALRELTPAVLSHWYGDMLDSGVGPSSADKSLTLVGNILQRAAEAEKIPANPARLVRRVKRPRRAEVRPLAPATVERMRAASTLRDATLISVLAYAGLRPGEALGLQWGDIRDRTILVERAVSLGEVKDTKTGQHRAVRLLRPLADDLAQWRAASGHPPDAELVFPSQTGGPWGQAAYQSWRRKAYRRALTAAGVEHSNVYALRHSAASLLLHEGRSVIDVARQLGHDASLTLSTYGHVVDELADAPQITAEDAILAARATKNAAVSESCRPSAASLEA